jgi:hypothetical protein
VHVDGHDALAADDTAWAVVPLPRRRTALLVTDDAASPLAQALRVIPGLSLQTLPPGTAGLAARAARADLTIVDAGMDAQPPGNLLLVEPPPGHDTPVAASHLTAEDARSPLLRGVDLSSLVIYSAPRAALPTWAHAALAGDTGPLLYSGVTGGRRMAVLLLDPRAHLRADGGNTGSNLATLIAFPLLLRNVVEALAPTPPSAATAGQPAAVPLAHRGTMWLRPAAAGIHATPGELAVLPALRPGLYTLDGSAAGHIAVDPPVPQDPLGPRDLALLAPAPSAPLPAAAIAVVPWDAWPVAIVLVLLLLSGEWWYYTQRT